MLMAITTCIVSGVFAKSWDSSWISSIKEILQVSAAFISSVFGLHLGKNTRNLFFLKFFLSFFLSFCCDMLPDAKVLLQFSKCNYSNYISLFNLITMLFRKYSVKRSNGLNVKTVLSGGNFLLMLFFPQDGHVLKTRGIQKGKKMFIHFCL